MILVFFFFLPFNICAPKGKYLFVLKMCFIQFFMKKLNKSKTNLKLAHLY